MKYKLISLDLDGTLLNNKKLISSKNLETIREAHKRGVHLALATGRNIHSTQLYDNYIGLNSSLITNNGSLIKMEDGTTITRDMDWDKVFEIISMAEEKGYHYNVVTPEYIYYHLEPIRHEYYYGDNEIVQHSDVVKHKIIESCSDIEELKEKVLKLHIVFEDEIDLQVFVEDMPYKGEFDITIARIDQVEICHKNASKASALQIIADYYGIKSEEIIAFGDSGNDLSMIKYAGMGVAMGNAMEIIKENANYITKSNEDDGVSYGIKKFVLDD